MNFNKEKDLAICGLACVLCSSEECPGCRAKGCREGSNCTIYKCAVEKGLEGCYQCKEFPCKEGMFQGVRSRAFNQYAKQFGKEALLKRLWDNYQNGISYHRPDGMKGDYDCLEMEEEVMQLIQFGRNNPYQDCPHYETKHFTLRLVSEEDAKALKFCYGDSKVTELMNNDGCPPGEWNYADRMEEVICGWLDQDYAKGYFIRFSVIDKVTQKVVGTVEIYDRKYQQADRTVGILRMDIAHSYEKEKLLMELIQISCHIFFTVFHSEVVLHKVMPTAVERISASRKYGFQPVEIEGREYYWAKK